MKPNQGRLQTGEHILARIIENKVSDAKVVIAKFDKENLGSVDFSTLTDLREINLEDLETQTNKIIKKELKINKKIFKREEIKDQFDLNKIPESVNEIRIVEIEGFDKRPCRDPHIDNTKEIGYFKIINIKKAGKDRYRFLFEIR